MYAVVFKFIIMAIGGSSLFTSMFLSSFPTFVMDIDVWNNSG